MSWTDDICEKHKGFVHVGPNCIMCAEDIASKPDWQPIDTAPRDGTRIHLGFAYMGFHDVVAHWTDGDWSLAGSGSHALRLRGRPAPSHWMPLPDPPDSLP